VRPQGPPEWPVPDSDILSALQEAYHSGSWGKYHGGEVEGFEEQLAKYHGVPFALTCGSGTFAVEAGLRALKVRVGDEVILAAYDYPGNFHSVHAVGAVPVLVDVGADNWNLAPERLAAGLSAKTRAIVVSHLHGGMVPMREVCDFAACHGIVVVEDAAQSPGAFVQGRRAGTWGDVGTLSFGGSKLLTAGRGGALLFRDESTYQRARVVLHRGNHVCPLSELQAAVLAPQLAKLDDRNYCRAESVRRLAEVLADVQGVRVFANGSLDCQPAYYKLGIQFDAPRFGLRRDVFLTALRAEGISVDEGFRALHVGRSPRRLRRAADLFEAERAHEGAVVLHHPVLLAGAEDIDAIALAVRRIYANAGRLAEAASE